MSDALIKLPKVFFVDHRERDLDTPVVVKETARYYFVSKSDQALSELLDDARHYASQNGPDVIFAGLKSSAKATVKALTEAGVA